MFVDACSQIRECIYGLMGLSKIGPTQVNATNGTGFMVAPEFLVTAAHFCHVANDRSKPIHTKFEGIRSPDIGEKSETVEFVIEDVERDIALLRITNPRSTSSVSLECGIVPTGTSCGSLGFPLAAVIFSATGRRFNLTERFQGASISAYHPNHTPTGRTLQIYETDSLMYGGSSGCPGFLRDAKVFGMHLASIVDKASAQTNAASQDQASGNRVAISIWVPAADIRDFVTDNGVTLVTDDA